MRHPSAPASHPKDQGCPKCGAGMESIDPGPEGLPLDHLQLCPRCYLVVWSDHEGFHVRQGVPMKKDLNPGGKSGRAAAEPEEC